MRASLRTNPPNMVMPSTTGSGEPCMELISELLENISRNPPALGARKLLVEHYISVGWLEAALENATELNRLSPGDHEIVEFLQVLEKRPELPAAEQSPSTSKARVPQPSKTVTEVREWDPKLGRYRKKTVPDASLSKTEQSVTIAELSQGVGPAQKELTDRFSALKNKAQNVLADLLRLQALQKNAGLPTSKNTHKVEAILKGRKGISGPNINAPSNVRSVGRTIKDNAKDAQQLIIADFEAFLSWALASQGEPAEVDAETVRTALIKRKIALEATLPEQLQVYCDIAIMHLEHENDCLDRNYINTETMVMCESITDITRDRFFVTEDNYAWDMSELVGAITSNGGVFRNPLSRDMFTPKDIKGILMHPLGKPLAALRVEQHEMSKGVRLATIEQMEKLASILLEDQSSDTIPSRKAVDEFLAYVATLPELEQKVIDGLKCPAKDSHTGQAYDFTIGDSVRDAKGNRVCFHKTGDFILQAAAHLRQNQGVAPEPDKCHVM